MPRSSFHVAFVPLAPLPMPGSPPHPNEGPETGFESSSLGSAELSLGIYERGVMTATFQGCGEDLMSQ